MGQSIDLYPLRGAELARAFHQPQEVEADEILEVQITPGNGTFFDENLDFKEPEGAEFTAQILTVYDKANPRQRGWKAEDLANHTMRLRKLLANAFRSLFYRDERSVLYFRGADVAAYRDKPSWMRYGSLGEVVDALVQAGLFQTIHGKKMPWYSKTKSTASSYAATNELERIAKETGVTRHSIEHRLPTDRLIRLFGPKRRQEFSLIKGGMIQPSKGEIIPYEPTTNTRQWTTALEAINAFYRRHDIGLDSSSEKFALWLAKRNDPERSKAAYRMPELFKTDVYRVFNNGDTANPKFDKGGRLFGGWWMSIGEDLRGAITIDGQPTVEIDYAECHARMLYHRAGLKVDGEPYTLPEIAAYEEATEVAPRTYRPYIKWLMQVLINCRGRPEFALKPDDIAMPPDFTVKQIISFIEAKHKPIVQDFRTGAGLDLMLIESDIALAIVSAAMVDGWPVLSVHDSFIAPVNQLDRLEALMNEVYIQRLGQAPVLKKTS